MTKLNNSKSIVKDAIKFKNPSRVPLFYTNCNQELSDLAFLSYAPARTFVETKPGLSEWGFIWGSLNETIGQAHDRPLESSWDAFESYIPPNPNLEERFSHWADFIEANKNQYIIGYLGITGFNIATFLRGFENFLEDLYLEPERVKQLLEMVFEYETEIIKNMLKFDIDAISFFDDWGTQKALMIHPQMWRDVFKPMYKKQFDLIHAHGKDVFFHCCGQIQDIIGDFIEIGHVNINSKGRC